jgi:dihydroorotate dehydrogenase (fumarate)
MTDLSTTYLDLRLKNPLIVSASPLSANVESIQQLEQAGAAAIVLPSLFEEQLELRDLGHHSVPATNKQSLPAELRHIPEMKEYNSGADGYLSLIYRAKKAVKIPVIASLNGYYGGGWVQYARLIEATGADALELNIYYLATKPHITSSEVEEMYLKLIAGVRSEISIPIAIKISPYFSAMANMAQQMANAGADGLVIFNRFYQPDIDLATEDIIPSLDLSDSSELRLRLRWTAILSHILNCDLAVTGGVHTAEDVLKSILAGANAAMMASALIKNGIDYLTTVLTDLESLMTQHEYDSINAIRGQLSQRQVADPSAFERANYMSVLKGKY